MIPDFNELAKSLANITSLLLAKEIFNMEKRFSEMLLFALPLKST